MFCTNCGTQNEDDVKFCVNCGACLEDTSEQLDTQEEAVNIMPFETMTPVISQEKSVGCVSKLKNPRNIVMAAAALAVEHGL